MEIRVKNSEEKEYKLFVENCNSKLGNIANFSVKKGIDAYCNKNCNKCYCNHMKMYEPHVTHVNENFRTIDNSINDNILKDNIINAISNYIVLNGCEAFRFNVEGDINHNYLDIIIEVAKNSPNCVIYLYTKNHDVIENQLHNIVTISNLKILLSIMNYNDSYIIDKFRKYENIKFFITTRNRQERLTYFKTYQLEWFDTCKNDSDKNVKCKGCKLCFNNDSQFIFNQYRGIKKVDKEIIKNTDIFNIINRLGKNDFLKQTLTEALTVIFFNTTATKKDLSNLNKLIDVKIRTYSKNARKEYGHCEKINNDYYKIVINNMNYYKTICVLVHELLHVLVFNDSHFGKFDRYSQEIEENTIFSCRGAKLKLHDINYKNSIELLTKVKELTKDYCLTYIFNSSYTYFCDRSKNQWLMELSNNIYDDISKIQGFEFTKYVNLRSVVVRVVQDTLNNEYNTILNNVNN